MSKIGETLFIVYFCLTGGLYNMRW